MLTFYGFLERRYTTNEVVDNYNSRKDAFSDLVYYFNSIRPKDTRIKIEFENKRFINKFNIITKDDSREYSNIEVKSPAIDSLLQMLKWNTSNLNELYQRLKDAKCISIQSNYYLPGDQSCEVGFQRSGMGIFYYLLFEPPIPDSLKANYNDGCRYVLISNEAAIRWYGGTIGPECMEGYKRGE